MDNKILLMLADKNLFFYIAFKAKKIKALTNS